MGPSPSPSIPRFPHRKNRDGTYDSICPVCVVTIASSNKEADLFAQERRHVCEESRLQHLKKLLQKATESDPQKMTLEAADAAAFPARMR